MQNEENVTTLEDKPDLVNIQDSTSHLSKPPLGNVFTCWTVLAKTMVGTGMLTLAYGFSKCGWVLGFVLLIFAAVGAVFTLHLLGCLAMRSQTRHVSFYTVAEDCAPWSRWIVDLAIAIKCIGVGISYIQVSSDTISLTINTLGGNFMNQTLLRDIIVVILVLVVSSICLAKSISRTAIVNVLGLVSVFYVVILCVCFIRLDTPTHILLPHSSDFLTVLSVFPTFIFAFTCHQNVFLCAEDLKNRTQGKLDIAAFAAEAIALSFYIVAIVFPYLTFGDTVSSNFLLSYDAHNPAVMVAYLLLGIAETCAFPLQVLPARKSLIVLAFRGKSISPRAELYSRLGVGTGILLLTIVVALSVRSLGVTLSFVGAVGSNTVTFIMPCFLYCMAIHKAGSPKGVKWVFSAILCIIGLIILPLCLSSLIYETVSK